MTARYPLLATGCLFLVGSNLLTFLPSYLLIFSPLLPAPCA